MSARRENRFREIDIFRAVAIGMVLLFHYLSRWTPPLHPENLYPYGQTFADVFLFRHGYLGVDFFFLISGFVIAFTLETCPSIWGFVARRAARLLPAMVLCSLLTLLIVSMLNAPAVLSDTAQVKNLLPSWTFSTPRIWNKLGSGFEHIDGVYWSLVVEVKFYVWAMLLAFLVRGAFAMNFFIFAMVTTLLYYVAKTFHVGALLSLDEFFLFGRYAPLFAAGVFFRELHKTPRRLGELAVFILACFAADLIVSSLDGEGSGAVAIVFKVCFFAAFFAVALGWKAPSGAISEALVKVGLASYPLYLLHQNIGVAMLHAGIGMSPLAQAGLFALVCAVMIAASIVIFDRFEGPGKRLILALTLKPRESAVK